MNLDKIISCILLSPFSRIVPLVSFRTLEAHEGKKRKGEKGKPTKEEGKIPDLKFRLRFIGEGEKAERRRRRKASFSPVSAAIGDL